MTESAHRTELSRLIAGLARATASEVRQTHISAVFLTPDTAYKLKKPVRLGFLDFSTPELRRHFCEEEVRLNRRLAPDVYLGVVPVVLTADGPAFEAAGEPTDWAVKMRRLPDDATMLERLRRGELSPEQIRAVARRIARFHHEAEAGPAVAAGGKWETVAANARDNFTQAAPEVGATVCPAVYDRLRELSEQALTELMPLITSRAERLIPRDTHGDLHLDHVYLFPDRPPPADIVAIDCIEFDRKYRFADPIADMAFLVMDLKFRGRRDLAELFAEEYFAATGDGEGRRLLPFYTAYRAVVRAKVEGLKRRQAEVPAEDRARAAEMARGYWLVALGELEVPDRRPALVLLCGLPGAGKSTLAAEFARRLGFAVVRSDVVRRDIAGGQAATGPAPLEGGMYTPELTAQTYAEVARRAEELLLVGGRVIVDANLRDDPVRGPFRDLARRLAVPLLLVVCEVPAEVARQRLRNRRGDASEADWRVFEWAASRWENPGPEWASHALTVRTDTGDAAALVAERLRSAGLAS